jgi:hypothetical protein
MAQSDLTIENQSFPSFRSDLNDALSAINSFQSGTSRPASAVAGTIWLDTTSATTPTLKYYDGADDISLATLDHASNTVNWLDSTVAFDIINDITPQLGGMLDVNGQAIGDGTLELVKFSETASAVNEITIANADTNNAPEISATGDDTDIDLKITPKGAGNLILDGFEFPNTDGTAGQVLQTDGYANLSFATPSGGANTPAFEASMGSDLTISGNTYTKATLNTEKFDIGSCYDSSTNYRFTPNVAGKYFMYGTYYVTMPNSNSNFVQCRIIKNGNIANGGVEVGLHASINSVISVTTQVVHEMNGSTDYLEFFVYQYDYNSGVSCDVRGNNVDGRQFNIFGGYRIIE